MWANNVLNLNKHSCSNDCRNISRFNLLFMFVCYDRNNKTAPLPLKAKDSARGTVMESYGGLGSKPGEYFSYIIFLVTINRVL